MQIPELWRTTTFRLTTVYGAAFALGVVLMLGLVYWRTAAALTDRVDVIVRAESASLAGSDPAALPGLLHRQGASGLNAYGLFSQDRIRVAGTLPRIPPPLAIDGPMADVGPGDGFPFHARAQARRLPWGEVLVVGRDVSQIREVRRFILDALVWSGGLIAGLGLISGVALSLGPLSRLRTLQAASHCIMAGDLSARMPIAGRRDELDLFAGMVNAMIEEVERLLSEVKSASDSVAHDLRTPLAHVRARLLRLQEEAGLAPAHRAAISDAVGELDLTLERFRALLRISQIEAQARRAGFRPADLAEVLRQAVDLYEPLAELRNITLYAVLGEAPQVDADDKLLFEAVSNLIDNAIKFSPDGGEVEVALMRTATAVEISIRDHGPGIAEGERQAVLERFQRGSGAGPIPGSGLGLSIVTAIARLHRFELRLEPASPGLRAVLVCPPPP